VRKFQYLTCHFLHDGTRHFWSHGGAETLNHEQKPGGLEHTYAGYHTVELGTNHLQGSSRLATMQIVHRKIGGLFRATGKSRSNPHRSYNIPPPRMLHSRSQEREKAVCTGESLFILPHFNLLFTKGLLFTKQDIQEPNRYYELSFKS
jgi:hypothetical protein